MRRRGWRAEVDCGWGGTVLAEAAEREPVQRRTRTAECARTDDGARAWRSESREAVVALSRQGDQPARRAAGQRERQARGRVRRPRQAARGRRRPARAHRSSK